MIPSIPSVRASGCLCVAALLSALAALPSSLTARIVDADAPVVSSKRGIGANYLSSADVAALEPGLSWYYNWGIAPLPAAEGSRLSYIPMVWNNDPSFLTALSSYLATHRRPPAVFVNNEPNLRGQAFITPEQSAFLLDQVRGITGSYGLPVVGPHMALGSAPEDSITAFDPLLGAVTTYTFMLPFLDAYLHFAGTEKVDGLGVHCYGNRWEDWWITETMAADYLKPLWVTEFNLSGSWSARASLEHMMAVVDRFERDPMVKGYAWFKERLGGDGFNDVLSPASGALTLLGKAYVGLPVHDASIEYRLPGRLQAERYLTTASFEISPSTDVNGLADMSSTAAAAQMDYQVFLNHGGAYRLYLRVAGTPGLLTVLQDGIPIGEVSSPGGDWSTQMLSVQLQKGHRRLSLTTETGGVRVNWLEVRGAAEGPGAPLDIEATAGDGLSTLTWQPSPGATSYRVYRSKRSGCCDQFLAETTALNFTDTGLVNGKEYRYQVRAVAAAVAGAASELIKIVPSPAASVTVPNSGFEEPYTYGFLSSPVDGWWSFGMNTGVAANRYGYTAGNDPAPEGRQVAYVQSDGRISQVLKGLTIGAHYQIRFLVSQRCGWGGAQGVKVNVDDVQIGTVYPEVGNPAYKEVVLEFIATSNIQTLSLTGANWGDNTALVDALSILRL